MSEDFSDVASARPLKRGLEGQILQVGIDGTHSWSSPALDIEKSHKELETSLKSIENRVKDLEERLSSAIEPAVNPAESFGASQEFFFVTREDLMKGLLEERPCTLSMMRCILNDTASPSFMGMWSSYEAPAGSTKYLKTSFVTPAPGIIRDIIFFDELDQVIASFHDLSYTKESLPCEISSLFPATIERSLFISAWNTWR